MDDFKHYTVMLNEAVDALECEKGKIYVVRSEGAAIVN